MPADSDAPNVSADVRLLATALDAVAKRLSGTAAARPAAASTPLDTIYYATDTGVFSLCTGAAWQTMIVAGAWQALTLGTSITSSGAYVASARLEGDTVRLKGTLTNGTGSTNTGTLATIPTGLRPGGVIDLSSSDTGHSTLAEIQITSTGLLSCANGLANAGTVTLDGLDYTLS